MQLRSTRYLLALTVMWGALSFHWTVLGNNIVPMHSSRAPPALRLSAMRGGALGFSALPAM